MEKLAKKGKGEGESDTKCQNPNSNSKTRQLPQRLSWVFSDFGEHEWKTKEEAVYEAT